MRSRGACLVGVFAFVTTTALAGPEILHDKSLGAIQKHCIEKFSPVLSQGSSAYSALAFCENVVGKDYNKFLDCYDWVSVRSARLFSNPGEARTSAAHDCTDSSTMQAPKTYSECQTWVSTSMNGALNPHHLTDYCKDAVVLQNFTEFKSCVQKIAAKYVWAEGHTACKTEKTRKNPELYLKQQADVDKCISMFATDMPSVASSAQATLEQSYSCIEASKIGQPFWSCYDSLTAHYKTSKLDSFTVSNGRYFYFTSCLSEKVRVNPKQFKACHDTLMTSKRFDEAPQYCQNKVIRDAPMKFLACVDTLSRGYALVDARKSCTIPLVLSDPAGFLKRNPGKKQVEVPVEAPVAETPKSGMKR